MIGAFSRAGDHNGRIHFGQALPEPAHFVVEAGELALDDRRGFNCLRIYERLLGPIKAFPDRHSWSLYRA